MTVQSVLINGRVDWGLVRQRAMDNAEDIDVALDHSGRAWVKDFPQFVRIPTVEAAPDRTVDWSKGPNQIIETHFIFRFINGKAEYVMDAVDVDNRPVGRLIHGAIDMARPEIDSDGYVITPEEADAKRQKQKQELAKNERST